MRNGTYKMENRAGVSCNLYPQADVCEPLEVKKDCKYFDWTIPAYWRSAKYNESGIFGPGKSAKFYSFIGTTPSNETSGLTTTKVELFSIYFSDSFKP